MLFRHRDSLLFTYVPVLCLILMSPECASSSVSLNALILKISLIMAAFWIFKPKVVISKGTGQVSNQGACLFSNYPTMSE